MSDEQKESDEVQELVVLASDLLTKPIEFEPQQKYRLKIVRDSVQGSF